MLGLLLTGYGIATAGDATRYAQSFSVNVNLWWGWSCFSSGCCSCGAPGEGGAARPRAPPRRIRRRRDDEAVRRLRPAAPGLGAGSSCKGIEVTLPVSVLSGVARAARPARPVRQGASGDPGIQHTPDDANQRHQLYVQWLNAHVGTPDVLQLDVVWTAEFAAAGWILPLDRYAPPTRDDFFPASLEANTWRGRLYAVPWFMDVGMLYWRTDLLSGAARHSGGAARSASPPRHARREAPVSSGRGRATRAWSRSSWRSSGATAASFSARTTRSWWILPPACAP